MTQEDRAVDLGRLHYLHDLQQRARVDSLESELSFIQSLKIEDKVAGGLINFRLWKFQREFIHLLREHDRVFALKSRQLGLHGRSSPTSCIRG